MTEIVHQGEQTAPALDLKALSANTMDDTELQIEVLQLFFIQSVTLICDLQDSPDDRTWYEAAHALKGGARSVGLLPLGHLAEEAEGMMGSINEVQRKAHCRRISTEIERARSAAGTNFPGIF